MPDDKKLYDEPYHFEQCTIQVSLQILPRGEGTDRQVVIGVRNHQDAPIVRTASLSTLTLPAILSEMLTQLESEMPTRKLLKDERELKEKAEAEKKAAKSPAKKAVSKPTAPTQPPANEIAASKPTDAPQPTGNITPMTQPALF